MSVNRTILHVDLDAFYCAVEANLNPDLKDRPFVVGGDPKGRGVVSSASYAAREFGIRSAMPTAMALSLCPNLLVIPPRHRIYNRVSKQVMQFLRESAPLVEQISIDEAFLDFSGDARTGEAIALHLKLEVQKRFDLSTSWGIATNKLTAKIATEVGKPNGVIHVPAGDEAAFLSELPTLMLWGVGPKTQARLADLGVERIGELARFDPERLVSIFGRRGADLHRRANGLDDSPVRAAREPKSLSAETTFARDLVSREELTKTLWRLSERVGARLRSKGVAGATIRLKVRWPDFKTITRQSRISRPTDQEREIYSVALKLFDEVWSPGRPVRLLGVGVAGLDSPVRQLSLFDQAWQKDQRLLEAVDAVRSKYGPDALRKATDL